VASSPAVTKPENSRLNPAATPATASKTREAAANGASAAPPVARPTTATPPPANRNELDKSKTAAAIAAARKSDSATPPKVEAKTAEKFVNNVARTLQSEEKSSSLAGTRRNPEASLPEQKSNKGVTERAVESPVTPAPPAISTSSSPAASRSASQPAVAPPEIYRGYTIEAATSYTKELAEQFASAYRKQGYDAAVERYLDERTNAQKYRVLIGAFPTRPAAEQKAAQMAGILMKDFRVVGLK
jgi:hypothetical protein